jgi:integrase
VGLPNPKTHSAKEIRLHQIDYLVATPAEHRLGHVETETKCLLRSDRRRYRKFLPVLRRGEINALHGGDFHLDTANPYWMLPAAFVKNRKEQPRPLHPELVAELRKLKAAGKLKPEDLVFPDGVPTMKEVRKDFKKAEIPLKDERGHVVDFHVLRTTYITRLQRAGVSPREAMELARHSDMRLTMKTYTDVAQLPLAATVRGLPSIGDSQIDSQTLVAERPAVSPTVICLKSIKVGKTVGNINGNHRASSIVTFGHENENGGERGIRTPDRAFGPITV